MHRFSQILCHAGGEFQDFTEWAEITELVGGSYGNRPGAYRTGLITVKGHEYKYGYVFIKSAYSATLT